MTTQTQWCQILKVQITFAWVLPLLVTFFVFLKKHLRATQVFNWTPFIFHYVLKYFPNTLYHTTPCAMLYGWRLCLTPMFSHTPVWDPAPPLSGNHPLSKTPTHVSILHRQTFVCLHQLGDCTHIFPFVIDYSKVFCKSVIYFSIEHAFYCLLIILPLG